MFIDQVKVTLVAGYGGRGCLSFRREKGVPRGGPDGGRGGDGGSIFLISDENINSLTYFRYKPINKASRGAHGEGSKRSGKRGEDLILKVPVGTVVREDNNKKIIFDFTRAGQKYLVAKGGKGGLGNAAFVSSTNRAPRIYEEGKSGEERELALELKLIADVGLVGFPNVGKSTLISKVSAAKPVIADYPFTTLIPNLGVVDLDEFKSFVIADIPGLIKGAHLGHGLGMQFLKHIERTKILAHIVDVSPYSQRNPREDYFIITKEIESFNKELIKRPQILIANKIDMLDNDKTRLAAVRQLAQKQGMPFFAISALEEKGLEQLIHAISRELQKEE